MLRRATPDRRRHHSITTRTATNRIIGRSMNGPPVARAPVERLGQIAEEDARRQEQHVVDHMHQHGHLETAGAPRHQGLGRADDEVGDEQPRVGGAVRQHETRCGDHSPDDQRRPGGWRTTRRRRADQTAGAVLLTGGLQRRGQQDNDEQDGRRRRLSSPENQFGLDEERIPHEDQPRSARRREPPGRTSASGSPPAPSSASAAAARRSAHCEQHGERHQQRPADRFSARKISGVTVIPTAGVASQEVRPVASVDDDRRLP